MTGFEGTAAAAMVVDIQFGVKLDEHSAERVFAHWAADGHSLHETARTIGESFFDIAARRFDVIVGR